MKDVVGIHCGIQYRVAFLTDRDHWRGMFFQHCERFRGEGRMDIVFSSSQSASTRLHVEAQRYIEGVLSNKTIEVFESNLAGSGISLAARYVDSPVEVHPESTDVFQGFRF